MNKTDKFKKTTYKIVQAVYEVLAKEEKKNINVQSICEVAEINRSTFYAHFPDLDSVLSLVNYDLLNLLEGIPNGTTIPNYETIVKVFQYLVNKKAFYTHYYSYGIPMNYKPLFYKIYSFLDGEDRELLAEFWSAATNDFVWHWVNGEEEITPEDMAKGFTKGIMPTIRKFKKEA